MSFYYNFLTCHQIVSQNFIIFNFSKIFLNIFRKNFQDFSKYSQSFTEKFLKFSKLLLKNFPTTHTKCWFNYAIFPHDKITCKLCSKIASKLCGFPPPNTSPFYCNVFSTFGEVNQFL